MYDEQSLCIRPGTMRAVEAIVSAHAGPGRVRGSEQGPCFSQQTSMYLAKHVGGWSATQIGRFCNGRHHTTVLYAIEKIERLRKRDGAWTLYSKF